MKTGVLILIDILHLQGAENIAVNIAINLQRTEKFLPIVCATRKGGILEEKLKDNGINCTILGRNHFLELYKFGPIFQLINDFNVKIIHAHKIGSNLWGSLISKYCNIPAISHYHGHNYNKDKKPSSIIANKIISALSSEIITASESIRQSLNKNLGVALSRITTVHNAIDVNLYRDNMAPELKARLGIKPGSWVVGILAALTEVKNHKLFLKAAGEVLSKKPDTYFLIIGEGQERKILEKTALDLRIENNCIFTGFRQDIPELLSIIDIGVLSSHSEGLPLSVIEYMASSKPVVATDVGGISELVRDGESGFIVPPNNSSALADKINLLIDNKEMARKMGLTGRAIIEDEFSEANMMNKIIDLYDKILSRNMN